MDEYLSQYVDQVLDSQEYQNRIFARSTLGKFFSLFFRTKN